MPCSPSDRILRRSSQNINTHQLIVVFILVNIFYFDRKWRTLSELLFYLILKERWTLYGKNNIGETVLGKVFMFWTRFLTLQVFWLCLWARIHSVCGRGVKFFWFVCFVFNIAEFPHKERGWGWGVDLLTITLYPNHLLIPTYM